MDISIIIPVYNAEQYLRECLDSALAQTVKEKEIICIDDGSTDGSYLILQNYQADYKQIRVLRQGNSGPGKARNVGLENAKGEYVCFLDADDYYMDKTALEQMIEACRIHKVKVCGSFRNRECENGKVEKFDLHRAKCNGFPKGVILEYSDYQEDYYYQNYIFCLDILKKNRIFFPNYRRYQDPPFFLRVMLVAKRMYILPVELYCYRVGHQDWSTHEKFIAHTLKGIRDNMKLSKENKLFDLQKKLTARINQEFYWPIANAFTEEIYNLLCEIEKEVEGRDCTIVHLAEISHYYKLRTSYNKLQSQYNELCASYYIMRMLVETRYKGIRIEKYLQSIQITNISIYGLGTFGMALYNELKHSKINILYAIDKKNINIKDLIVFADMNDIQECDAIIVTPLKECNHIANELKKKTEIAVYTLIEILNEVEKTHM